MQTQLTNSLVQVRIVENEAEAQLVRARKQAEQVVVTAQAESQQRILSGRGEGARNPPGGQGLSEASVLLQKIESFSDPRLYALSIVAGEPAKCTQPLVPERVFIAGGAGGNGSAGDQSLTAAGGPAAGSGLMGLLLSLLVAEKSGFSMAEHPAESGLRTFTEQVTRQAMESIQQAVGAGASSTVAHRGNGAVPPEVAVTVAGPTSRLDGLDIGPEGTDRAARPVRDRRNLFAAAGRLRSSGQPAARDCLISHSERLTVLASIGRGRDATRSRPRARMARSIPCCLAKRVRHRPLWLTATPPQLVFCHFP